MGARSNKTVAEGRYEIEWGGECECGCGLPVRIAPYTMIKQGWIKGQPVRFRRGHQNKGIRKLPAGVSPEGPNPSGLCMCGCGERTALAPFCDATKGWVIGTPKRYKVGHNHRGVTRRPETLERMSAAHKGKRVGPDHQRWRGGVSIRDGRRYLWVGRDHPMATSDGYVAEYRLIAAEHRGSLLTNDEVVHHIDGDTGNNAVSNLLVCSPSQHSRIHGALRHKGMSPREAVEYVMGVAA